MRTLYFYKDRDGYQEYPVPTEDELSGFWIIEVNDDFVFQGQRVDQKTGQLNAVIPDDVLIAQISVQQGSLIRAASSQIEILNDIVTIGTPTDADTALLAAWRKYRIDLYNVPKQANYPQLVNWPVAPV